MKLEVGMYVRMENDVEDIVIINKIANVFETTILTENDGSIYQGEYTKENVIEASYNIIDLISRFDLVNGHLVICKMYEDEKDIPTIIKCVGDYYFKEEDIKSVITHEQMEQIAYKVGD